MGTETNTEETSGVIMERLIRLTRILHENNTHGYAGPGKAWEDCMNEAMNLILDAEEDIDE